MKFTVGRLLKVGDKAADYSSQASARYLRFTFLVLAAAS